MLVITVCLWILSNHFVWCEDVTSQQNDIIPDQALRMPYGTFCYFTCSELIFQNNMKQVAPSAYRVTAARLVDLKLISSDTSEPYESLWGALYFVQREDYQNIIKYASTQNAVPFVATMQVETIENETAQCVSTDMGLQPNAYPFTQSCDSCNSGSGGSSNKPSMDDYQNELALMGVPSSYLQTVSQLPTMQNQYPPSDQQQQQPAATSATTASPAASSSTPPTPIASAQTQSQPSPQQTKSPPASSGTSTNNNNQPTSTGQPPHQLQSTSTTPTQGPQTFQKPKSPPYAPFNNQFVSQSPTPTTMYSSMGASPSTSSYGTYQPSSNFYSGPSSTRYAQPSSQFIPGFTLASYSSEFSYLQPQYGSTLTEYMNSQSSVTSGWLNTGANTGASASVGVPFAGASAGVGI